MILRPPLFFSLLFSTFLVGLSIGLPISPFLGPCFALDVINETMTEPGPAAFNPGTLGLEDFEIELSSPELAKWSAKWIPGSIQWVRVRDVLTLARAQFSLKFSGVKGGRLVYPDGKIFPLTGSHLASGRLVAPLPLCSGPECAVQFEYQTADREASVSIAAKFRPRDENQPAEKRVLLDPSCSPWKLRLNELKENGAFHWAMVGCRLSHHKGDRVRLGVLEVRVLLDRVGVQSPPFLPLSPLTTFQVYRLTAESTTLQVPLDHGVMALSFEMPQIDHAGHLGLGFGPYFHQFTGYGDLKNQMAFLLNVDATYQLDPKIILNAFGFTVGSESLFTDLGLYARIENFRDLDRHLGFHLLIGGQVVLFKTERGANFFFAFPQGFEFEYLDFFQKGKNLTFGGFIYPPVNSYSYYNFWIRWGGSLFFELDTVFWQTSSKDGDVSSSSVGLSFGGAVWDFL